MSVKSDTVNFIDPIYEIPGLSEDKINTYYRETGTVASRWVRTQSQTATYTSNQITFTDTYKQYWYRLNNMFTRLTFQIQNQNSAAFANAAGNPLTRPYIALIPCFLASQLSIIISGQEVNQVGSKIYLYKLAYLLKLFNTDSKFLDAIKYNQGYYVNTGLGGFDINPNVLFVNTTGAVNPLAAVYNNQNVYQQNLSANDGLALGNQAIQEYPSLTYNKGFLEACIFYYNAYTTNVVVEIPLADYCPFLQNCRGVLSGFQMSITITSPSNGEMFLNPNTTAAVGGAIAPPPVTSLAQITWALNGAELWVQIVEPSNEVKAVLYQRFSTSYVERVKYIDWDVIRSSNLILNNNSLNNIQFTNVLNRKPVCAFFGFQYVDLFGQQYANPHQYVNIFPTTVQIQIGQAQLFPRYPIQTYPVNNDFTALYNEFLKVLDIMPGNDGPVRKVDYQNFCQNIFLISGDFRDIEPETFSLSTPSTITLFTDLNLNIPANAAAYAADLLNASRNGTVPCPNANQLLSYANRPDLPTGTGNGFYCWLFLGSERCYEIQYTPSGINIRIDVVDEK